MKPLLPRQTLYAGTFSLLLTIVVLVGMYFGIRYSISKQQENFATELLMVIDAVAAEVHFNVQALNGLGVDKCDAQLLTTMRRFMFKSRYVKEIGFYENDAVVCTTSLGILPTPNPITSPDFTAPNGYQVWSYQASDLFESEYLTNTVRLDKFHVVVDPLELISLESKRFSWQWVHRRNAKVVSLYGEDWLYQKVASQGASMFDVSQIQCSDIEPYCIVSQEDMREAVSTIQWIALLLILILCAVLLYGLCILIIEFWYSPEQRVKRGIKLKLFYPLYQPIVILDTGEIIGCEVLARFTDKLGDLSPVEFIPLVSKMGKTAEFTRLILQIASTELVRQNALFDGFKVNFNIFPNDLTIDNLERIRRHKRFFNKRLKICFEITEDEPSLNEDLHYILAELKSLNIEVAIDDFGTGYSNLEQLQSIPFDYLKIDRSFAKGLEDTSFRASLIPQIIKIADVLEVPLIAEGVETLDQRRMLNRMGVVYAQGYLFSKPINEKELGQLVLAQDDY